MHPTRLRRTALHTRRGTGRASTCGLHMQSERCGLEHRPWVRAGWALVAGHQSAWFCKGVSTPQAGPPRALVAAHALSTFSSGRGHSGWPRGASADGAACAVGSCARRLLHGTWRAQLAPELVCVTNCCFLRRKAVRRTTAAVSTPNRSRARLLGARPTAPRRLLPARASQIQRCCSPSAPLARTGSQAGVIEHAAQGTSAGRCVRPGTILLLAMGVGRHARHARGAGPWRLRSADAICGKVLISRDIR